MPCSLVEANRRFGGTRRLHSQGQRVSHTGNQTERVICFVNSHTPKMEAVYSFEKSMNFYRIIWCRIQENSVPKNGNLFITFNYTETQNVIYPLRSFGEETCWRKHLLIIKKLRGLSPRATAACQRSQCQLLWIEGTKWSVWRIPYGRILGILDRSRYFFFQVATQLYSWGWMDPRSRPTTSPKIW
jgi:hypothetical protein